MGELRTRKRGKTWEYSFEAAKVEGKRKTISKGGFRTKTDAIAAGTQAKAEYDNAGIVFTPSEMSVADYMNYWYEQYVLVNLRPNTQSSKKNIINNHIVPKLGHYKLKALTPTILQDFINQIKLNGFSENMLIGIKSCLSSALSYAVHPCNFLSSNPMIYVKSPKYTDINKKRNKVGINNWIVTHECFETIINRFNENSNFYIPLMIGYYAGLRIGETFALTWNDINLKEKTLTVNKQLIKHNRCWFVSPPKTNNSYRTIYIGDILVNALKTIKKRQLENKMNYGEFYFHTYKLDNNLIRQSMQNELITGEELDFICKKENGELLTQESFKYCARVIHYELEISEFHYHALRHTHGTILAENGANPVAVRDRLGHADIKVTLNNYTFNTKKMGIDAVNIFENNA
ncbi:MAG: tyrosine-type recombinase/integrase [Lachnospiraceae bacterium]